MTTISKHLLTLAIAASAALPSISSADETAAPHHDKMQWWREARYGMFIHWGLYAVPAGVYDGKDVGWYGEWIMNSAKIPVDEYAKFAKQFNPVKFNADEWANLAKQAGMKYLIITAKHHDGFCMYQTKVDDFNIVAGTPFKRDPVKELAAACAKRGIKFGVYYSQAQDWHHPGGGMMVNSWDQKQEGNYDDYLQKVSIPQVRELLAEVKPAVLWFDTPIDMKPERTKEFLAVLKPYPGLIYNNRLGNGVHGDTETPEQEIPATGFPGRDWETCMTMNDTWGYKTKDNNYKSTETLLRNLIDIASKGGNYLLNVGPDAEGRIPQPSIDRLTQVGEWMKVNGEAVYGTHASPFKCRIPWGRVTSKPDGSDTVLYLHVLDMPKDGRLLLTGLKNECLSANFLADGSAATLERSPFGPCIMVAEGKCPQGSFGTTIKVRIKGHPEVEPVPVLADADGVYRLTPMDAKLTGEIPLDQQFGFDRIGPWQDPAAAVSWSVHSSQTGSYRLVVRSVTPDSAGPVLSVRAIGDFQFEVPASKDWKRDYPPRELGMVTLKKGERVKIELKPVAKEWKPVYIHQVELVPAELSH
jgi:alpha-L-fucosidase